MINLIWSVRVRRAGTDDEFTELAMIPATGSIQRTVKNTGKGKELTYKLDFRLWHSLPILHCDLEVRVYLSSGKIMAFGTGDMPVRFTEEKTDYVKISTTYKTAL